MLSTAVSCSADLLDSRAHEFDDTTAASIATETLELIFGGESDQFSPMDYVSFAFYTTSPSG